MELREAPMFKLFTGDMASPEPSGPTVVREYDADQWGDAVTDFFAAALQKNAAQLTYAPHAE